MIQQHNLGSWIQCEMTTLGPAADWCWIGRTSHHMWNSIGDAGDVECRNASNHSHYIFRILSCSLSQLVHAAAVWPSISRKCQIVLHYDVRIWLYAITVTTATSKYYRNIYKPTFSKRLLFFSLRLLFFCMRSSQWPQGGRHHPPSTSEPALPTRGLTVYGPVMVPTSPKGEGPPGALTELSSFFV